MGNSIVSARTNGIDMRTSVGTVQLANPIMTASGTAGHGAELSRYFDLGELGALVVKSLSIMPWPGICTTRGCLLYTSPSPRD